MITDGKIRVGAQVLKLLRSIYSITHLEPAEPGLVNDTSPLCNANDRSRDSMLHTPVPCTCSLVIHIETSVKAPDVN